jgi:flagellar protein FliO/FliZ
MLFAFPSLLFAAEDPPGVSAMNYWQAFAALIFIVILLVALAAAGRYFLGGKGFGQGQIKLLSGLALGPRERIVLIEVEGECLLVGIVPGQIRTLLRMKKSAEDMPSQTGEPPAPAQFSRLLKEALRRFYPGNAAP